MSVKTMSREEVIKKLLEKDYMKHNASPKLVEAVERTYSLMSKQKLEDMYWYCYHRDVQVQE